MTADPICAECGDLNFPAHPCRRPPAGFTVDWVPRDNEPHIQDGIIRATVPGSADDHLLVLVNEPVLDHPDRPWYWQLHPSFGSFREGDATTEAEAKAAVWAAFEALPDKGTPR